MGSLRSSADDAPDEDEGGSAAPLAEVPVDELPGVGPARLELLQRVGVKSVEDLLLLAPRRVLEFSACTDLKQIPELNGRRVRVRGRLGPPSHLRRGGRRSLTRARLTGVGGTVDALWFNQPWARKKVAELCAEAVEVELFGQVVKTKSGFALASPRLRPAPDDEPLTAEREPVYPTTAGLGQDFLRGLVRTALERYGTSLSDPLLSDVLERLALPPLRDAVRELHAPTTPGRIGAARRRLALEQALCLQARLLDGRSRTGAARGGTAPALELDEPARSALFAQLPFEPTAAQRRATLEVLDDLALGSPMRRLLQGDVGSGKTLVAAAAALAVAGSGRQAALLAPTTLLAEQHAAKLGPLFERAGRRVALLTAGLTGAARRAVEEEVQSGAVDLVVGTHALMSERVRFHRLALAIVDEQQRFGVAAKRELLGKGVSVHALLVTATPIPRTLALALYGELDVSVLDELPPGRQGVSTRVLEPAERRKALALVRQRLEAGERAFWVCPRIAESDEADAAGPEAGGDQEDVASAERAFRGLAGGSLGAHGVVLVHGAQRPEDRANRLESFRAGDSRLLVGTSVVEVGLDVPEATVIVVESAERMGLSQLHQLRGRVGRGRLPGFCVLLVKKGAHKRLEILESSNDGFHIAEEDLRRRGAGELVGVAQAGGGEDWDAEWGGDLDLLIEARALLSGNARLRAVYAARRGRVQEVALV